VIDETGHMCFLSATEEGKAHEKSVADLEGDTFPRGRCLYQDMGGQGYTCEGITIAQPKNPPLVGTAPHGSKRPLVPARPSAVESTPRVVG
jgi:hypothetical protein